MKRKIAEIADIEITTSDGENFKIEELEKTDYERLLNGVEQLKILHGIEIPVSDENS